MRLLFTLTLLCLTLLAMYGAADSKRPNILWIVSEDNTILLGCYGDKIVRTPTLDALAADGVRYAHAYAPAPVCAATRNAIITGRYATGLGTQNMRSKEPLPDGAIYWPELMREAGYYCTNNSKTDYNTSTNRMKEAWDESSNKAHYKNRPDGKPFFAIFNLTVSHESSLHKGAKIKTDPNSVTVQPYLPDNKQTRSNIAQYYDKVGAMDSQVGNVLDELKKAGLADDTIVFYYSDHGGVLPRSKRFLYANGRQVPLIIHYGKNVKDLESHTSGDVVNDVVNLIDMPPTVLSLCGIKPPEFMQGRAIAGQYKAPARQYDYSYRDRMDEVYDCGRSVTDGKFCYIRNYLPLVPNGMHLDYLWKQASMKEWADLFNQGKLNPVQSAFFLAKPVEELFDTTTDWDCVKNLANDPAYKADLERLRAANHAHMLRIRDTAFIPEPLSTTLRGDMPPATYAADESRYPLTRLVELVDTMQIAQDTAAIVSASTDANPSVRLWALVASQQLKDLPAGLDLKAALKDEQPLCAITAAEALLRRGADADASAVINDVLKKTKHWQVRLAALNVIQRLNLQAQFTEGLTAAKAVDDTDYIKRLTGYLLNK